MLRKTIQKTLIAAFLLLPVMAHAAVSDVFLDGVAPKLHNERVAATLKMICYSSYCSDYFPFFREPLAVGEHLTASNIAQARYQSRKGISFFPEPSLPSDARSELSDYQRSGYDRGHMAPWADNADLNSFSLANIVPQNSDNNRHLWEHIEVTVRGLAQRYGEVYVVSGPIFGQRVEMLKGRVAIPQALYKAVYIPSIGKGAAYITPNQEGNNYERISLSRLTNILHINVFPTLSGEEQEKIADLPEIH